MNKDPSALINLLKEYYEPEYFNVSQAIQSWQKFLNKAKSAGFNYSEINSVKEQVNLKVKYSSFL